METQAADVPYAARREHLLQRLVHRRVATHVREHLHGRVASQYLQRLAAEQVGEGQLHGHTRLQGVEAQPRLPARDAEQAAAKPGKIGEAKTRQATEQESVAHVGLAGGKPRRCAHAPQHAGRQFPPGRLASPYPETPERVLLRTDVARRHGLAYQRAEVAQVLAHGAVTLPEAGEETGEILCERLADVAERGGWPEPAQQAHGGHHIVPRALPTATGMHGLFGESREGEAGNGLPAADLTAQHGQGDFHALHPQPQLHTLHAQHEVVEEGVQPVSVRVSHHHRASRVPARGAEVDTGGEIRLTPVLTGFELHEGFPGTVEGMLAVVDVAVSYFFHLFCVFVRKITHK